jgi:hypothetical protein
LTGANGRYTASFSFRLVSHLGPRDFAAACVAGLQAQGIGYPDRFNLDCGQPTIGF